MKWGGLPLPINVVLLQRQLEADRAAQVAFLRPLFVIARNIFLALRLSVAGDASLAVIQWEHHSDGGSALHLLADDFLALPWIRGVRKLLEDGRFILIGFVLRVAEQFIDRRLLHIDVVFGSELCGRLRAEGGRNKSLKSHAWFIDRFRSEERRVGKECRSLCCSCLQRRNGICMCGA